MRKLIFILFFLTSIFSNAQIAFQNLAVRRPLVYDKYTYIYTGSLQKFIIPNKVTTIQINAIGALGGTGGGGQTGGAGANITTTLNVTPGQVLYIVVGGSPGQSATAKYGYGGNGGLANSVSDYGGAGGGLSGVFSSSTPANANAFVIAGGGGGGSGTGGTTGYTGGAALNTSTGSAANGVGSTAYLVSGRYQYGYGASMTAVGVGGNAYDNAPAQNGADGNDINGGVGGLGTIWQGAGGGGGGYFGGGGGAGGGSANGGGGGGSTKTTTGINSFGQVNTSGDGSVTITCYTNSGLVLNLDAGNTSSYIGSGNTWNDLTGVSSNVTTTSTTYNSSNSGNISFNGTTSYADFTANIGSTNVVTVEMWVKTNSLVSPTGMYFGFGLYDAWTNGGNIGFNTGAGDLYGIPSAQVNYLGIVGNWRHLVFVMYSGSKTNNKIYVDGISQTLSQVSGTFGSINSNFNSGLGRISSWRNDLSWKLNIQVASFKIYKRELTQQEITNNYNAYRSKYYAENDGLSPGTASTSAYQIKKDYPNSTDGFYWIKNANINGGTPFKIYADMTTDGGGWTLILKNSSNTVWTYSNAIAYNTNIPYTANADITNTSTASYSIIGWADYIKQSASGFQYMIDAGSRRSYGGIWTANGNYSFVNTNNTQTNVTWNTKFGNWNYVTNNNGIQQRMPWYGNVGSGSGFITLCDGTGYWWGTLNANNNGYTPSPWISDAGGGTANQNPGIIWYWVR